MNVVEGLWSWQQMDYLGAGAFGTVYLVRRESKAIASPSSPQRRCFFVRRLQPNCCAGSGNIVVKEAETDDTVVIGAIKITAYHDWDPDENEVEILKLLQPHPHIIQLLDFEKVTCNTKELKFVTEYCAGGDLQVLLDSLNQFVYKRCKVGESIASDHRLGLDVVLSITRQILLAIQHCEKHRIIHCDLKPHNILLRSDSSIAVCDFGSAYVCDRYDDVRGPTFCLKEKTSLVTLWYRAPEILLGCTEFGTGVDIWSIGCILLEMLMGYPQFVGNSHENQLEYIFAALGTPSPTPAGKKHTCEYTKKSWCELITTLDTDSVSIYHLLAQMLDIDVDTRGNASYLLQHETFFTIKKK